MKDAVVFPLVLLAAICAECIPLMAALVGAAVACLYFGKPYRECPYCGAHLDPGEQCDCPEAQKDTAPSATNTRDGEMDQKVAETN